MTRLERAAVLLSLIQAMRTNGSWCGETHIQKASYFLQKLLHVPLGTDFVLYKHGPYSFDLTDELTALRADGILAIQVRDPKYGPSFVPGPSNQVVLDRYSEVARKFRSQVEFVASHLGERGVADLECLATALYVRIRDGADTPADARAKHITELKPHISLANARDTVREVDMICKEAGALTV